MTGKEHIGEDWDMSQAGELIVRTLRENGFCITKQRLMLIGIILENECSSCKDIYYQASKLDPGIGMATVYRMVNVLEEIGAIKRKNLYQVISI